MTWSFLRNEQSGQNNSKKKNQRRRGDAARRRKHRFEQLERRDLLTTFHVTNLTDAAVAPAGSLRAAIDAANAAAGADVIQFDLAGTVPLAIGAGDLDITDSVSIIGLGNFIDATLSVSRIFNITDVAGDVSLRGLSLIEGIAGAGNSGGAIFSDTLGLLTIADSSITGNQADQGGGIYAVGNLSLTNVVVGGVGPQANVASTGLGGGIYVLGNATLLNSTISGNSSALGGGGIYGFGSVNIQNSTIGGLTLADGNSTSGNGGGISAQTITLDNSTVSGNASVNIGAGIYARGSLVARNSTISGNEADDSGGGIHGFNVTLQNVTIANNVANADNMLLGSGGGAFVTNSFRMNNSIVVGNTTLNTGTAPDLNIPTGVASRVRFSLIGDKTDLPMGAQFTVTGPAGPPNGSGNLIGMPGGANAISVTDAFGAGGSTLANNGGPTATIALTAGSIAINSGNNALAANPAQGDQRGLPFVRVSPLAGSVDMGAFEFQTVVPNIAPVVANAIADQTATVGNFYTLTFPANTFTDADGDVLTYSATLSGGGALPAWLSFNSGSRTFSGTPTAADVGAISVRVTASDGKGGSAFDDFALTVITNPPPVVANPIPDRNAAVGVPFTFTFAANTFTDPNGDPLTYSALLSGGGALPAWLSFNAATRTFSGTPAAGDVGVLSIRVTANDGQGGTVFDDFNLTVSASELPFNENFEGAVDPRIVQKSPTFTTTASGPLEGTTSFRATRPTVGSRPVATVDFVNPATAANVTNVSVNVSTEPGNGSSLWANALVTFDYQSPTNYKFAGVFEIIDRLIIGQVVNGQVQYLAQRQFTAASNTTIPLNVAINRVTRQVTLTSGATVVMHTYGALGTGTVGVGTINANAKFDSLVIT